MPLQNRVTPFGEIVAVPDRGSLMGNRGGCLHDGARRLGRARWRSAAWIACLLDFKGRRRTPMTPGLYTELFFLDEATALAAGHRPCAECRRPAFEAFRRAWAAASGTAPPRAPEMDRVLHAERLDGQGGKRRHEAVLEELPDGAMVERDGAAWLVEGGRLLRWTPAGYAEAVPHAPGPALLLTPPATVAVLREGYRPLPPALGPMSDG